MAIVSALGAAITFLLSRNIRDIPEGRGLEDVSQPRLAPGPHTAQPAG